LLKIHFDPQYFQTQPTSKSFALFENSQLVAQTIPPILWAAKIGTSSRNDLHFAGKIPILFEK